MKLNRPRVRVRIGRALTAVGVSAMLAGGALATQAAASPGPAVHNPAHHAVVRLRNRSALRAFVRQPDGRVSRVGLRRPGRSARAADACCAFSVHITPNNTFYLQLDMSGASTASFGPLIDWWTNGGANQSWTFQPVTDYPDTYEIINQNSGQCLFSDGIPGDQVYQLPCNAADQRSQWFTGLRPNTWPSSYNIENVASGLELDVYGDSPWPGASIDTWYSNGGENQFFKAD